MRTQEGHPWTMLGAQGDSRPGRPRVETHKRAVFYIAAPTHLVAGDAFFSRLQERVTSCLGAAAASTVFLPSIIECNGKWTLEAVNMDIKRSQAVLRSLLFTLGFENEAPAVTTYSLRRFLPTIGETLQLTEAERSSLGNWVGGVTMQEGKKSKIPMHVRYSDSRLEECGNVKRLLLSLLGQGDQLEQSAVHAQLAFMVPEVDTHRTWVRGAGWGSFSAAGAAETTCSTAISSSTAPRIISSPSTSRSSSVSSSSSTTSATDTSHVRWLVPRWRGYVLHLARPPPAEPGMRYCSHLPLGWGYEEGQGPLTAAATGRAICQVCSRMVDSIVSEAFQRARLDQAGACV